MKYLLSLFIFFTAYAAQAEYIITETNTYKASKLGSEIYVDVDSRNVSAVQIINVENKTKIHRADAVTRSGRIIPLYNLERTLRGNQRVTSRANLIGRDIDYVVINASSSAIGSRGRFRVRVIGGDRYRPAPRHPRQPREPRRPRRPLPPRPHR